MRVHAHVHYYPPYRMAGSETMAHAMMRALADAGHEVTVVVSDMPEAPPSFEYDGIKCLSRAGVSAATAQVIVDRPDVVVSHHQNATHANLAARRIGAKSVFVQHNTFGMNKQILATRPDLTVFNTEWIAAQYEHKAGAWMVVHPPVWPKDHATTPGDHVTLVNLSRHKGVEVFQKLSRAFPDVPFLGVMGGHGEQITWGHSPNVAVVPQTTNMRDDVWAKTKVLLVPSVYESYGMVAAEAVMSGIPVMAAPTPGLVECLGEAGTFTPRDAPARWVVRLRELLGAPGAWDAASAASLRRATALDPKPELEDWVRAVEGLVPALVPVPA
ncbi:glycosyltransferase family 4 protein [Streptomyces sp. NPDC056053]|uniref:glycosyltransferase family 4 protein n=1 Tax=Streptomyces sp. NPDC056053 TaxID=3345696 RepID=UPI0035D5E4AA